MPRFLLIFFLSAAASLTVAAQRFWRGADISWSTEMMADGKAFYNTEGRPTEINALMRECGMNAIRLRVWAEPSLGGWCGTADVVQKALAARAAGMEVLIDFHYSDFFSDPGRQAIPSTWQANTIEDLAQCVSRHTTEVLQALKNAGVKPRWVQIGNETRSGMLYSVYDAATHKWTDATGRPTGSTDAARNGGWENFARLSNAGYDAAKNVFPDVLCITHLDTQNGEKDLTWWFDAFRAKGGKTDVIGLSHYPMPWNAAGETAATTLGKQRNSAFVTLADKLAQRYSLPVLVVETGVYCEYVSGGKEVLEDLFRQCRAGSTIGGVFYWEPEQYNWWKPAIYDTLGWGNYNMCAFLNDGRPSAILDAFRPTPEEGEAEAVHHLTVNPSKDCREYRLNGRRAGQQARGIIVSRCGKVIR